MAKKRIMIDISNLPSLGGKARAAALSDEDLSAAGRNAVNARWEKYYREHPEKRKAKGKKSAK